MNDKVVIGGETSLAKIIDGQVSLTTNVDGNAGAYIPVYPDAYSGETTVTPSEDTQTLLTHGKMIGSDITVLPIPSNYGRIAYSGGILTVY